MAFDYVIESPLVVKWYAQNIGIPDDERNKKKGALNKLYPMPIGLDYHTLATRLDKVPYWASGHRDGAGGGANRHAEEALKDRKLKVASTFHLNYLQMRQASPPRGGWRLPANWWTTRRRRSQGQTWEEQAHTVSGLPMGVA